jgi:hypothetical protein
MKWELTKEGEDDEEASADVTQPKFLMNFPIHPTTTHHCWLAHQGSSRTLSVPSCRQVSFLTLYETQPEVSSHLHPIQPAVCTGIYTVYDTKTYPVKMQTYLMCVLQVWSDTDVCLFEYSVWSDTDVCLFEYS